MCLGINNLPRTLHEGKRGVVVLELMFAMCIVTCRCRLDVSNFTGD